MMAQALQVPLFLDDLIQSWPYLTAILLTVMALAASVHAIVRWEDPRSTVAWVGLIWLSPLLGPVLYWILGVNRIRRRALALRKNLPRGARHLFVGETESPEAVVEAVGRENSHLTRLTRIVGEFCSNPLTRGNQIEPLFNGDEAYPEMIRAIEQARCSVALETYIFDNDRVGRRFVAALAAATRRGVEVRVLIDGVGARYTFPSVVWRLRRAGVRTGVFLRTLFPWSWAYANLRDHRKVMVVDGRIGFAGGMNIRAGNVLSDFGSRAERARSAIQDIQFRIEGPLVSQLQRAFAENWAFTTGEALTGEIWFGNPAERGLAVARGIPDGPDDRNQSIRWAMLGAIATARSSIRIATPYFLPDAALTTLLSVAAMSGVQVEIVLPEKSNLTLVQWAMNSFLPELVRQGCRVRLAKPPFDHSKVMIIDGAWVLFGSSNWDARSLRLSFEFNVEAYDPGLAGKMNRWFDCKVGESRLVTLDELESRNPLLRFRDGIARLFSPYL